jgi:hypothetical protein
VPLASREHFCDPADLPAAARAPERVAVARAQAGPPGWSVDQESHRVITQESHGYWLPRLAQPGPRSTASIPRVAVRPDRRSSTVTLLQR